MEITKRQFADLLDGLGATYISSGAYEGQRSVMTVGSLLKAIADEVRGNPTETYEIPPERQQS